MEQPGPLGEGVQADQEVVDNAGAGVVGAVVELPVGVIVDTEHVVPLLEVVSSLGRAQGTHGEVQVPEVALVGHQKFLGVEVDQDPGHDWVLGRVRIRSAGDVVELHQVLEVGHFVGVPLGQVPIVLQYLLRVRRFGQVNQVRALVPFQLG